MHYNGSVPEAPRKTTWRDAGACLDQDPDLFAPDGTTGRWADVIADAKAVCGRCTVVEQCLAWALETRQDHGIYGGLTEDERRNLHRRTNRGTHKPRGPKLPHPTSLRELFDRHTQPQPGGHLLWTGAKCPDFRTRQYTPNQIAFILDRGYEPNGSVHRLCDVRGCVQALHLADTQERRQRAAARAVV
jgi:hypothetical protein